jgi:hypothetical protein
MTVNLDLKMVSLFCYLDISLIVEMFFCKKYLLNFSNLPQSAISHEPWLPRSPLMLNPCQGLSAPTDARQMDCNSYELLKYLVYKKKKYLWIIWCPQAILSVSYHIYGLWEPNGVPRHIFWRKMTMPGISWDLKWIGYTNNIEILLISPGLL